MKLALITAALTLPIVALALYGRSTRPTEAPDAVSAGWAYFVGQQVAMRDAAEAAGHRTYLDWIRSL